jgi:hypothetical protein
MLSAQTDHRAVAAPEPDRPCRAHRIALGLRALAAFVGLTLIALMPSAASAAPNSSSVTALSQSSASSSTEQFTAGSTGVTPRASCRQNTQAWVGAFGFGILHSDVPGRTLTVPAGTDIFHTGIVVPNTRIRFDYGNPDTGVVFSVWSAFAGSNCVVAHEQATLDTEIFRGTRWVVGAVYIAWETNTFRSTILGTLVVT